MSLYKEDLNNVFIPEIKEIRFSLVNPNELINTVEITNHNLYMSTSDNNSKAYPEIGGLYDSRMGVIDNYIKCETCKQKNSLCPGHFSHIKLCKPVFYMHFMPKVLKVLKCVCYSCSKVLIPKTHEIFKSNLTNHLKFEKILLECKKIKRCNENHNGCGAILPTRYFKHKHNIGEIYAEWKTSDKKTNKVLLDAEMVQCIFKKITDEDITLLTFDPQYSRPEWMICHIFPVSPPSVRPSVRQDNNQRSDDDLTYKLIEIIKINMKLEIQIKEKKPEKTIKNYIETLQYHIATLINNEAPFGSGVPPAIVQRSGRLLKSLIERIKSKDGRIRGNLMGKRVDFSARSVITPDPTIKLNELGVPIKIAMNLSYPEKVHRNNINKMKLLILNGPHNYPGAKTVFKARYSSLKDLNYVNLKQIANDLEIGDIVNRHIIDGDTCLFNRQPSLHKMSMMGHSIKVMPGLTFRLNVAACNPYNADFDGDEMNLHMPQSVECVAELMHIANVNSQIINPNTCDPVIFLIQDPKLAIYMIGLEHEQLAKTKPYEDMDNKYYFDRKNFMDLMIYNTEFTNIKQTPADSHGYYSGEQILSTILPSINYVNANLNITNGVLKGTIIKNDTTIIHKIYNKFGKNKASEFINNSQNVLNQYLSKTGFSVGISDLIINDDIKSDIKDILKEKIKNIDKILYNIQNGLLEKQYCNSLYDEFELLVNKELNTAVDVAGNILLKNLNPVNNRFIMMATAGSKGKSLNLSQMISCVGQQNLEGKRIPYHFGNRTLPHFPQFDNSALSKGFVESSFYGGLNVFEYFFHAMGGREGLIDTAVKTSETGYIQRRLVKAMEDIKICYDNTVRNHNDHILQFSYGDDNMNPIKLEKIKLHKEILCDLLNFENKYKNYINDDLKFVLEDNIYKQTIQDKSNTVFDKYYDDLLDARIYIINLFGTKIENDQIISPVNIDNLILDNKNLFGLNNNLSDISPLYIIETIYNLIDEFAKEFDNKIFRITLLFKLSPYSIIINHHLTTIIFDKLVEDIKKIFYNSFIDPGTMVGTIAAQAMGEKTTQMTLNTFHSAGVSANSSVIQGLPRLKELLNISKNLKSPSISIHLKKKNLDLLEIKEIENNIIIIIINNIIISTSIYFDPDDENTVIAEDKEFIDDYIKFQTEFQVNDLFENNITRCPFVLRLEVDKYKMVKYDLSMSDIYNKMIALYGNNLDIIYSENDSEKLIFRIKFKEELNPLTDYLELLKKLENNILKITLNGIKNITATNVNKFKNINIVEEGANKGTYEIYEDITIETSGTNLIDIINLDYVDSTKTISNHIHEVFSIYGIEVAKQLLFNEYIKTFYSSGATVDYRHYLLLINIITYKGYLMSIDRFGIKKSDFGILAQASFEETPELLSRAGIFAETDKMTGVSANIMLGQRIHGGTGMFKLLFDEVHYFSNFNKIHNIETNLSVYNIENLEPYINFNNIDDIELSLPEVIINLI